VKKTLVSKQREKPSRGGNFPTTDDAMYASAFYQVDVKKMEQQSKKCVFELRWKYDG
jgi:hypothetical protein